MVGNRSLFNEFTNTNGDKSEKIIDLGILEEKDLLEILCFYRSDGKHDWFGCTGVIGVYNTYKYICNYKKPDEVVYKFISEYNLP